jgi:autotransporter passenger strand-loop-strand repeat protein
MTDLVVSSGYSSNNVTVNNGDTLTVLSGGSATSTTISSGGSATVSSGGTVTGTTIFNGGYETVSAGGFATGTTVDSGAAEYVLSGGSATGVTVSSGGAEEVSAGGTVVSTTVAPFGVLYLSGISSDAVISANTSEGGIEYVFSGGAAVSTTVLGGAEMVVSSGGMATGTVVSGGTLLVKGGIVSGTIVLNNGEEEVGPRGSAVGTTVGNTGYEYVSSGTAISTTISNGGNQYVGKGGTAIGAIVIGGFQTVVSGKVSATTVSNGGTQIISSGGKASGTTIDSGGTEIVSRGGTATGTTISNGGSETVFSSGATAATTVSNGGTLIVSSGGAASATTIDSGGTAIISKGGVLSGLTVSSGGTLELTSGALVSGTDTISSGGTLEAGSGYTVGNGTAIGGISGGVTGFTVAALSGGIVSGLIVKNGGLVEILSGGKASNTVLSSGGTLDVQSGGIVSGSITFSGTGGMLAIDGTGLPTDPSKLVGATISGFAAGDTIDLTGITYSAGGQVNLIGGNELQIIEGGQTYDLQLSLSQSFAGDFFHLANDGNGGTKIAENTTPCYCRGTLIRTADGDVAVEDLRIGHDVVTAEGDARPIKWIGRRAYRDWLAVGNPDVQPILLKAGSIADHVPVRDLYVSPEHAMFLDGVLVPARHLVNGVSIVKVEGMEEIEYFHLEFDRHVVILAEGAAAESFVDDDSRMLFHNADEYRRLYSDEPRGYAEFCAPRVEDGVALDTVRGTLAARAAQLRRGGVAAQWVRRGNVELATRTLLAGWAFAGADAGPVPLAILANGAVIGRVVADRHRPDLEAAGVGDGRHGFRFRLPKGLAAETGHRIEVRRETDWSLLAAPATLAAGRLV